MRKISESTVRRLSLYLRFLEQFDAQGQTTISSAELARRGGTTSAQVRKDLSFFGSFGKDRKSTRLNSSHGYISYAVFCLKKKKNKHIPRQLLLRQPADRAQHTLRLS